MEVELPLATLCPQKTRRVIVKEIPQGKQHSSLSRQEPVSESPKQQSTCPQGPPSASTDPRDLSSDVGRTVPSRFEGSCFFSNNIT